MPVLLTAIEDWYCPNCSTTDRTNGLPANAARFHICPGLHLLTAPMIRAGIRCKVTATEREDYLGDEVQATGDDGKAYMNVRTTRDDGDDVAVNAGLATGSLAEAWAAGAGQIGFG
jgi:hypothetical protein